MRMRTMNKLFASVAGYFWTPCPICDQYFGGHEWRDIDGLSSVIYPGGENPGKGICPDCTRAGKGDPS
jgi:hypothetical protein